MSTIAKKLKTIRIKVNPPRRGRGELLRKLNVGTEPKYQISTRGIGRSLADSAEALKKYRDNFDTAFGKKA